MITVEVIADSVNSNGERITTFALTYPRMIHSELMTHRVFSRNAQSSRAVPGNGMRAMIRAQPAEPIHWGKNQKGMQAGTELTGWRLKAAKLFWRYHKWQSLVSSWLLDKVGAHKQISNRLLEPHSHIRVIVTSTSWANFIALRDHYDAEPTFQALAAEVRHKLEMSVPKPLKTGEWHLPFIGEEDEGLSTETALKVSVARCARVSYYTHENGVKRRSTLNDDLKLYDRLVGAQPLHASPAEHQAKSDPKAEVAVHWGNFTGWIQYRKTLQHEYVEDTPFNFYAYVAPAPGISVFNAYETAYNDGRLK